MSGFQDHRQSVARKEHRCGELRCTIRPGDVYHVVSGVSDGDWYRFKVCRSCYGWVMAAALWHNKNRPWDEDEGPVIGWTDCYLMDHFGWDDGIFQVEPEEALGWRDFARLEKTGGSEGVIMEEMET